MTDLLIDATGTAIAALIGYFNVRDEDSLIARRMIRAYAARRRSIENGGEK